MMTSTVSSAPVSETVFVNTQRKATKKFDFTVIRNSDGSYQVSQQAFRVYQSGHEEIKSTKLWAADNLQALCNGDFMKNRQGKIFLQSQVIH